MINTVLMAFTAGAQNKVSPFDSGVTFAQEISVVNRVVETRECPAGFQAAGEGCIKSERVRAESFCVQGRLEGTRCLERATHAPFCPICTVADGLDCLSRDHLRPIRKCPPGYKDSGMDCSVELPIAKIFTCPEGYEQAGADCVKVSYSSVLSSKVCPAGFSLNKGGQCSARKAARCLGKGPQPPAGKGPRAYHVVDEHKKKKHHGHDGHRHLKGHKLRHLGHKKNIGKEMYPRHHVL